jgi:hypothetical protein
VLPCTWTAETTFLENVPVQPDRTNLLAILLNDALRLHILADCVVRNVIEAATKQRQSTSSLRWMLTPNAPKCSAISQLEAPLSVCPLWRRRNSQNNDTKSILVIWGTKRRAVLSIDHTDEVGYSRDDLEHAE